MKWRKLIELSTSSSPPKSGARSPRPARRRAMFEALENRKLFAIDLAEVSVAEDSVAEVTTAEVTAVEVTAVELFSSEALPVEQIADEKIQLAELKFDEAADIFQPEIWTFGVPTDDIEIRMMTFRGGDAVDGVDLVESEEVLDDTGLDSPIMYMTGAVDEFDVQTLDADVDLSAISYMVDDTVAIDEAISDEDLMFYSLGSDPEVETTSLEESLLAEDVNGDGIVTALDMLLVVNALNSYGAMPGSQLAALPEVAATANWDINGDGYVTPLDALLLTNYFNSSGAAATVESSQDALVAPIVARVRQPVDDELTDEPVDVSLENDLS